MPLMIDVYGRLCDDQEQQGPAKITVVNIAGPGQPSEDAPAFRLVPHHWYRDFPMLCPVDDDRSGFRGPMAGGNYAGSTDSRWIDGVSKITGTRACRLVPLYDRFEIAEGGAR